MPLLQLEPFLFPDDLLNTSIVGEADTGPTRWWVLYTRPRAEKRLARCLFQKRLPFFLPLYQHRWRTQGRWLTSYLPLFPCYLFLHGDSEGRLKALQTNLVTMCLPVVDQKRLWGDLARVYQLMKSGAPLSPVERLRVGDEVEITTGPLAGLTGTILRGRKVRFCVEVQMLRRGVSVDIEGWMLRPLPGSCNSP
jgi:hypothetical protein